MGSANIKDIVDFIFYLKNEYKNTNNIFYKLYIKYEFHKIIKKIKEMKNYVLTKEIISEFILVYMNNIDYNIYDKIKIKVYVDKYFYKMTIIDTGINIITSIMNNNILITNNNMRIDLVDTLLPISYKYDRDKFEIIIIINELIINIIIDFIINLIKKER